MANKPATPAASESTKQKSNSSKKVVLIIGLVMAVLFFMLMSIILVIAIFASPSSETVFKDMQKEMLQTESVSIDQKYKLNSKDGENLEMSSRANIVLTDAFKAKGDFTLDIMTQNVPMTIQGDYVAIDDAKYVKFTNLYSSNAEVQASFNSVEPKINNKWIKARESDSYSPFVTAVIDPLANTLPVPYANLSDQQQESVLAILQNKSMYMISETAKVELNGESTYKYSLTYSSDLYKQLQKKLAEYTGYIKADEDTDNSEIKQLTIWVDIQSRRIVKMAFEGSGSEGQISGLIVFSNYNESFTVNKPENYSIESELLGQ